MSSRMPLVLALLVALSVVEVTRAQRGRGVDQILEFDTMVGVISPFTGSSNPIRGVNGGGLPWTLTSARGELGTDGRLEVQVRGLVLVNTGANPAATFNAVVSCLTIAGGLASTMNVPAGPMPATNTGDADFDTFVTLPSPCIAPIVFVTNGAGTSWFAATGL